MISATASFAHEQSRRRFRSPTSTGLAARTSWCSTARPSSSIPTASAWSNCATGRKSLLATDWERTSEGWRCTTRETHKVDAFPEDVYRAMMLGLHDYVERNGFKGVILGLSGGIDSALSAAIAVDALGPDRVWCVMLPSKYTSDESLEDARECARASGLPS